VTPPGRRLTRIGVLIAGLLLAPALLPSPVLAAPASSLDAGLVLLEVRLDGQVLSDAVTAYQIGRDVFLPLGEMARLLTLAIRVDPGAGRASGYILREERTFSLDVPGRTIIAGGTPAMPLDPAQVQLLPDDIYVASTLLTRWLPVDVDLDMAGLGLTVRPREQLPLQARQMRRGRGSPSGPGGYVDPGYPRVVTPYRMLSVPFIDQTVGLAAGRNNGMPVREASYTGYLTADLLGMEAALYASRDRRDAASGLRLTLGRHDPDGGLLGSLHARTVLAGSVALPGVTNLSTGSPTGNGAYLSNRPLDQPTSFDRTSLQGDLPPGWDVELYYNDALIGFQQSRADGKYSFTDVPLAYGPNAFRLVFHGPLGQSRVERRNFLLEQSAVPRGAVFYDLAAQRDRQGRRRALAQVEWGIGEHVNATALWQQVPTQSSAVDGSQGIARVGLRSYLDALILTADVARADDGGRLAQLGAKTRVGGIALSASRALLDGFTGELFHRRADPVRTRDEVRAEGAAIVGAGAGVGSNVLPFALELRRDALASGRQNVDVQGRVALYRDGTALSNALRWQSLDGIRLADGVLQVSRRVADIGLTGQVQYRLRPAAGLGSVAVSADRYLAGGYLLNLGLARIFDGRELRLNAALNKSLGAYGLGVHGFWSNRHTYGAGLQFFMALGREPRSRRLLVEAQPMAGMGAAAVHVFLDRNQNGVLDDGETPIAGAAFTVNGANHLARTDGAGLAWLSRLPAHQPLDLGLAPDSLEDPQWQPRRKGVRIVPRPGIVDQVDFAVSTTGEIDGTAYLVKAGARRPIGDLRLEVVDAAGKVVAGIDSAADGYYVITGLFPGTYRLRVAPEQLARLGLQGPPARPVEIGPEGTILNGRDMEVSAVTPHAVQ
jgi:hypothetical protein